MCLPPEGPTQRSPLSRPVTDVCVVLAITPENTLSVACDLLPGRLVAQGLTGSDGQKGLAQDQKRVRFERDRYKPEHTLPARINMSA